MITMHRRYFTSLLELSSTYVKSNSKNQLELVKSLQDNGVLRNPNVINAFRMVDRALYIPDSEDYAEPYENIPITIDRVSRSTMSTPHHHCIIAENATSKNTELDILDLGCGSGYLSTIFSILFAPRKVFAVDAVPALVDFVKSKQIENVQVLQAYNDNDLVFKGKQFAFIHCGFAVPESFMKTLRDNHLGNHGRMIAPVLDEAGKQTLVAIDKDATGRCTTNPLMEAVHCQAMFPGNFIPPKSRLETLKDVEKELSNWKTKFEKQHGRPPKREDMFADTIASALFEKFARLRK